MRASLARSRCPVFARLLRASNSWSDNGWPSSSRGSTRCDIYVSRRRLASGPHRSSSVWFMAAGCFVFVESCVFELRFPSEHTHTTGEGWRGLESGVVGLLLLILCSIASSWFFAAGRKWNCAVGRVLALLLLLRPRWHAAGSDPFTSRWGALARTGRCTAGSPCWPARRCRRP